MDFLLDIERIEAHGLELDEALSREELARMLDVRPPTPFAAVDGGRLRARFRKANDRELVGEGSFEPNLSAPCDRCLKDTTVRVPVRFQLDFVDEARLEELEAAAREGDDDRGEGERAGTFDADQVDQVGYRGKQLDLFPVLQEQLLLAVPDSVRCREACKGLCAVCGKDRNQDACTCDTHVPDPRWAALKNVKLS